MSALNALPIEPQAQKARPRVLIADDSRVIRLAIKKILGGEYDLVEVGDGASAWERISQDPEIKALITDIEMPQLDGYELICRIRGGDDTRLHELPVIAITGAEDDATKQRAFACGATDFIVKPIDAIQLRARVQAYVRYDQTTRDLVEKTATLEDQAVMDSDTGLCSRRYLLQRGEQDMAFAMRREKDLTLIYIDIDNFRKLYKTHGDDVSEALLAWFGKLLLSNARTEDTAARIGGTEFAILVAASSVKEANTLCQRLNDSIAKQPFRHGDLTIPITLSMGLASLMQDRQIDIESLMKLAQQRLCHAQSEGGARVCTSILGDVPAVEEVQVPALELVPELEPLPEPKEELKAELKDVDNLTVSELEGLLRAESEHLLDMPVAEEPGLAFAGTATPEHIPVLANEIAPHSPGELLSIDKALYLLAQGRQQMLLPYLDELVRQFQPLLELANQIRRDKAE